MAGPLSPLRAYAGRNISPDRSVLDESPSAGISDTLAGLLSSMKESLRREGPLALLGPVGSMLTYSPEAEASVVKKMLQGIYRGYAGEKATSPIYYHGGDYVPGDKITKPLYMTRNPELAESYVWAKGGNLSKLSPQPRKTAPQSILDELAAEFVPGNAANDYTPASALDESLHGERAVGRLLHELGRPPRGYDSVRAFDVGFGSPGNTPSGEVMAMLPGSKVLPAPTDPVFASPQRSVAEYYAKKRAAQTGEAPHVEMLLVDPFAGKSYGHATADNQVTKARKLKPEDIEEVFKMYRKGGLARVKECNCGR